MYLENVVRQESLAQLQQWKDVALGTEARLVDFFHQNFQLLVFLFPLLKIRYFVEPVFVQGVESVGLRGGVVAVDPRLDPSVLLLLVVG